MRISSRLCGRWGAVQGGADLDPHRGRDHRLAIGVWEYRRMIRYLWGSEFRSVAGIDEMPWHTPTLLLAVVLIAIGVFAFAAVWLRI